jgi:hypothetical protein
MSFLDKLTVSGSKKLLALDREVGTLMDGTSVAHPRLFRYARYNAELTREGLAVLGLQDVKPEDVQKLDSIEHIADLQRVGRAVAAAKLSAAHFKGFI